MTKIDDEAEDITNRLFRHWNARNQTMKSRQHRGIDLALDAYGEIMDLREEVEYLKGRLEDYKKIITNVYYVLEDAVDDEYGFPLRNNINFSVKKD